MDHETGHKDEWLELRCRYAFVVYDGDGDGLLNESEFSSMVREIRRMRKLGTEGSEFLDAVREEASKFPPQSHISFQDFSNHVKGSIFRGTSFLFRFETDVRQQFPTLPQAPSSPSHHHHHNHPSSLQAQGPQTPLPHGGGYHQAQPAFTNGLIPTTPSPTGSPASLERKVRFHPKRVIVDNSPSNSPIKKSIQVLDTTTCSYALKKVGNINQPFLPAEDTRAKVPRNVALTIVHGLLLMREGPKILADDPFTLCLPDDIRMLCEEARTHCLSDAMMVEVSGTVKVFGDIHGQLYDLLALFEAYGSPNDMTGDIDDISYVFLGDFVDRGPYSLEVVSLLCSLKILYPSRVFLIRGNHEDRTMNCQYGFKAECQKRVGKGAANM